MTDTLDLAPAAILTRAADIIETDGHTKGDFANSEGYCAAGAIGKSCGLRAGDWYDDREFAPKRSEYTVNGDFDDEAYEADCWAWKDGRAASLAALRTLAAHIDPERSPEAMSRRELLELVSGWNDHDEDSCAERVAAAMRGAAREEVSGRG